MVAVKLWGGLGNQMFQYAFGLYLAKKREEIPYFFFEMNHSNSNAFANNVFNIDIQFLSIEELNKLEYNFSKVLFYRIKRKVIQLFPFVSSKIFVEKELFYLPKINDEYILFDGYWQSYKYLEPIEHKLRKAFAFENTFISNSNLYKSICNCTSVSLHIRRGDYLDGKNVKRFKVCSLSYYESAIIKLTEKFISPVFYIFSNDLKWAKEHLKVLENVRMEFVDSSNYENSSIVDLFLMSKCRHHIIANSTFSWWAAWLNPNLDKVVIAPKHWYNGKLNNSTKDLIPETWIRI